MRFQRKKQIDYVSAILGLALFVGTPAVAAEPGEAARRAPIRFEHLTDEDGLAQITVRAFLEDRQGFLSP